MKLLYRSQLSELRDIYENDIINTIQESFDNRYLSYEDYSLLLSITQYLFEYLYSKYSSIKEVDEMLRDRSIEFKVDKYIDEVDELKEKLALKDEEFALKLAEKDKIIEQLQKELNESKS